MALFTIGRGQEPAELILNMLMRHGLITGATGTGKTVTLKGIAEHLSDNGIQVFLADVKGDLASLAEPIERNEAIDKRLASIGMTDFTPKSFPVTLWDVYGERGIPLRTSVSELGPVLLSRLLNLNDTQAGVMDVAFRVADAEGLLLLDLDDLKAMLGHLSERSSELRTQYGNIAPQSVGAIIRAILSLEEQDGDILIGEPALHAEDLLKRPGDEGMIHVLAAQKLYLKPKMFSTLLLWLFSELYETLPEVGDVEKPKLVFFFDEAHLLFDDAPKALVDKIEMMVRLIRSKGVGVFFVTQSPFDIPPNVLAQLGNKIQHALRAYTPQELKNVRQIAQTFREREGIDVAETITQLKTGQALVSLLDEEGIPKPVDVVTIAPPRSHLGTIEAAREQELIQASPFLFKYKERVNRESAYELLTSRAEQLHREKEEAEREERLRKEEAARAKEEAALQKEELKLQAQREREAAVQAREEAKVRAAQERAAAAQKRSASSREGYVERFTKNILGTAGREVGRQIMRGILGNLKR